MASKGQIHDSFAKLVTTTASQSAKAAESMRGGGLRPWMQPAGWQGDPLDIAGATAPFDRSDIDSNYEDVVADGSSPGTAGDAAALKLQSAWVAVMERGYRARHCTPVRCMAMLLARRAAHGHDNGILTGGVLTHVQDILRAGQS